MIIADWPKMATWLQDRQTRGLSFALLSTMGTAVAPLATKLATQDFNSESFTAVWCFLAFAGASAFAAGTQGTRPFWIERRSWIMVFSMGVFVVISVLTFTAAIRMADATVVAFYTRLEAVFTVVMGLLFFKEHLSRTEALGATMLIAGMLLMAYGGGQVVLLALLLGATTAFSNSIATMIAKVTVRHAEPAVMVAFSRLTAGTLALAYAYALGVLQWPSVQSLAFTAVGAFFAPFLGFMFMYKALALANMSKVSILRAAFPFFVALYSFLLFGTIPTVIQLVGGVIIVTGLVLLVKGQVARKSETRSTAVPV